MCWRYKRRLEGSCVEEEVLLRWEKHRAQHEEPDGQSEHVKLSDHFPTVAEVQNALACAAEFHHKASRYFIDF